VDQFFRVEGSMWSNKKKEYGVKVVERTICEKKIKR